MICEVLVLCFLNLLIRRSADALQCYSCRGSASNEVEANIRCLQNAYLEDCDEFYAYYSEVEDQNVLSYEYYNYEKENLIEKPNKKPRGKARERDGRPRAHRRHMAKDERLPRERTKRQANRLANAKDNTGKLKNDVTNSKSDDLDDTLNDYGYYYQNYNYTYDDVAAGKPIEQLDEDTVGGDQNSPSDLKGKEQSETLSLPKDPEHHCYSRTIKKAWESYAVEKGCKKIAYCNNLIEKNPEWSNPWNFCCDKARCNAKLVKDKPQRIFGMGCRQTDDCIQGMTTRPVCPNWYKSCPKISTAVVKMECRSKSKTKGKYLYAFKEKKCYCAPGYRPKGPICTNGSGNRLSSKAVFFLAAIHTLWVIKLQ